MTQYITRLCLLQNSSNDVKKSQLFHQQKWLTNRSIDFMWNTKRSVIVYNVCHISGAILWSFGLKPQRLSIYLWSDQLKKEHLLILLDVRLLLNQ